MNTAVEKQSPQVLASTWKPHPPLVKLPIKLCRLRLSYRWLRYLLWSARHGHSYGARTAIQSVAMLWLLTLKDLGGAKTVECNICGWTGGQFYPNCGSGYFETRMNCPRCSCIGRYRALAALLDVETGFFSPEKSVLEVAPVRTFQSYCLWRKKNANYLSFDLERFGMEKGDITAMRHKDNAFDYFLCFHVMEHVQDDAKAVREIFRVLRPGGQAALQVPIDYSLSDTVEYGRAVPTETYHFRRYSKSGFRKRLEGEGFSVRTIGVADLFPQNIIDHFGWDPEPVYFATKPS